MNVSILEDRINPTTLVKLSRAESNNVFYWHAAILIARSESEFSFNTDCPIVPRAPIDGILQEGWPLSLPVRILYLSSHRPIAEHTGKRYVYNNERRNY